VGYAPVQTNDSTNISSPFLRGETGRYVTGRPKSLRPSHREVKNNVWKYLQTIVICLYAVCEQKLAHPDRVLILLKVPGSGVDELNYLDSDNRASLLSLI